MDTKKMFISLAATLLLVGAGCDGTATNSPISSSAPDNTNAPAQGAMSIPDTSAKALTTTVTLDDTWKTYTSTGVGIAFKWPTKGTYAPTWAVLFPKANDDKISNGCYGTADTTTQVTVDSNKFCHTSSVAKDGTPGDYYTTQIGDQTVVLSFTKAIPADNKTFSMDDYHAFLDQIVSTFVVTK